METYPIMIDGKLEGKLTVDRQGVRTVFDAVCKPRPDLVRISVYGGDREGYLGVLAPAEGMLRLRRVLSRTALREFPEAIDTVERSGRPAPPRDSELEDAPEAATLSAQEDCPVPVAEIASEPVAPDQKADTDQNVATDADPDDTDDLDLEIDMGDIDDDNGDMDMDPDDSFLSWYASPDGALVCYDGAQTLIALPLDDPRVPENLVGEERVVEGRSYLVYRTRDGRIVQTED